MHEEVSLAKKRPTPVDGTLRKFALRVPECIYKASGILVFGKRIKSLVFSTDLCIIRNVNADAIIAVYPFTPQPVITQALMLAADIPVFAGVGGGLTQGQRAVNLAMFAEMQGATGVVLNAPTSNEVLEHVSHADIDWSKVTAYHMDEYVGLAPDAPQRFARYLDEHIFSKVNFGKVNYLAGDDGKLNPVYSDMFTHNRADISREL